MAEELNRALETLAQRGTRAGATVVLERAREIGPSRRWKPPLSAGAALSWPRGLIIAAGAAFAVLLIVGVALLASLPETGQPTSTSSVDVAGSRGIAGDAWGQVSGETTGVVGAVIDVARLGSELFAVGIVEGADQRLDAAVFSSIDGHQWAPIALDDETLTNGFVSPYGGLVAGGPGLVAAGSSCDDPDEACPMHPSVWTSTHGTAWDRVAHDEEVFGEWGDIADVIVADGRIIAVGSTGTGSDVDDVLRLDLRPTVWTSADGLTWTRSWEGSPAPSSIGPSDDGSPTVEGMPRLVTQLIFPHMQAVAVDPQGNLVAVGYRCDDPSGCVAVAWTSQDGTRWERVPHDPAAFASAGLDVVMLDVAASETGFVAVGSEGNEPGYEACTECRPVIWTSPDGTTWSRVELAGSFAATKSIGVVAAGGPGFVAVAPHWLGSGPVTMWTSPDGHSWTQTGEFGIGYALSLFDSDASIFAVGAADFTGAVWASPPPAGDPTVEAATAASTSEEAVVAAFEAAVNAGDASAALALLDVEECNFPDRARNCRDFIEYLVATNAQLDSTCVETPSVVADAMFSCDVRRSSDLTEFLGTAIELVLITVTDGAIVDYNAFIESEMDNGFLDYVNEHRPDLTDDYWLILTAATADSLVQLAEDYRAGR